jgi:hypothetical protein
MRYSLLAILLVAGCHSDEVDSEKKAANAYLGLDGLVETSIDLGFKGISDTNGATIPAEMASGLKSGTVTVTGTVDQGVSQNKNMYLKLALVKFSNDGHVTYDAPVEGKPQPALDMRIAKAASLSGTLMGEFAMSGDLKGSVILMLTFTSTLETGADSKLHRKAGTTHVTGTAMSSAGTYNVDIMR